MIGGYEGFIGNDGNDIEIPSMYSQGLDMSSDDIMGTRPRQASDGRNASSRSKRKWVGQTVETVKIIYNSIEYTNDQLYHIVD